MSCSNFAYYIKHLELKANDIEFIKKKIKTTLKSPFQTEALCSFKKEEIKK